MNTLNEEIARLKAAKANIDEVLIARGVSIPENATLDIYHNLINSIQGGTSSSEVTATRENVLVGTTTITADSNDEIVEGTMVNHGAVSQSLNCGDSYTIPAGYHNGSGEITVNSLAGQTPGTATTSDIVSGCTAWVNGSKITGNLAVQSILSFNAAPYSTTQITFTWKNPEKGAFSGVIIVGKTGDYPENINDGTRWYKGTGSNISAEGVSTQIIDGFTQGTTYYFKAFAYAIKDDAEWIGESLTANATTAAKGIQTFTSSGTFTVPSGVTSIDIFCVGGGGGSSSGSHGTSNPDYDTWLHYGAGGGGYTTTKKGYAVTPGQTFAVTIGAGGYGDPSTSTMKQDTVTGGTTSFGTVVSAGGGCGGSRYYNEGLLYLSYAYPGNGGSGGGASGDSGNAKAGGSNGGAGGGWQAASRYIPGGKGQGTTTRAFGESSGTLYAGGGGGAGRPPGAGGAGGGGLGAYSYGGSTVINNSATPGTANTGGGGGGSYPKKTNAAAKGGSGICIVRWGY